jgi:predicted RNA methylase
MLNKEKVIFEDESYEVEMDSRDSEFIAAAFNSLGAIEMLDTGLMNEEQKDVINTIQYQAIAIISESINNIYNEIFDTTADSSNDLVL